VVIPPVNPWTLPATRTVSGYLHFNDYVKFDDKISLPYNHTGNAKWLKSSFDNIYSWEDLPLTGQNHAGLTNLDYTNAGHTGFQPTLGYVPLSIDHLTTFDHTLFALTSDVHSVPSGGLVGQVLSKLSGTDYDLYWNSIPSSMVYPGIGIAISTGSAWGASIVDNSANWNTAYGWGNHAGLYVPVSHLVTFVHADIAHTNRSALDLVSGTNTGDQTIGTLSPLTTKGDLFTFSTLNTRLGVGTNDYVLVSDSTTTTGLAWKQVNGISGVGTVTSVSIVNSSGFSGTITNATTTPAITLAATDLTVLNSLTISGTYPQRYKIGNYAMLSADILNYNYYLFGAGTCVLNSSDSYGAGNIGIGNSCMLSLSLYTPQHNLGIGNSALYSLTSGDYNLAIGNSALYTNTIRGKNIAIGFEASKLSTGSNDECVAIGFRALFNNTDYGNVALGNTASFGNINGAFNTAIGTAAAFTQNGYYNVYLGYTCAQGVGASDANYNTMLGAFAGQYLSTSNNVFIGYKAGSYSLDASSFYVDAFDRTNTAGDKAGALFYGGFHATPSSQFLYINAGDIRLGTNASNYTKFDSTGHQTMVGTAKPWRDELGDAISLKSIGIGVTANATESVMEFTTLANLNDYLYKNLQLNHDRDETANIYPHIHFFQDNNNAPNFLVRYRWHKNGSAKTTAWSEYKCNTLAFTYVSGTLHQIAHGAGITPPSGSTISDIIQFRIFRDNANTSTVFTGADPYTGTVGMLSYDVHIQLSSIGSTDEYTK
jgi:hypothetical protein